jgi:hypothetical protein
MKSKLNDLSKQLNKDISLLKAKILERKAGIFDVLKLKVIYIKRLFTIIIKNR